jgi:hypothetical protein
MLLSRNGLFRKPLHLRRSVLLRRPPSGYARLHARVESSERGTVSSLSVTATPALSLTPPATHQDFNFTGASLYYKDSPLSSGECKTDSWYESSGSNCIYTYHYQDTYVAYFYPDGPLERAIDLKFVLDADNVNVDSFNASAFLEVVSSRLDIALDRMTLKVVKGATASGQVQVTVGLRDSKAWERDLVDRWADDAYVADFAPEFFVQAITYAEAQPDGPASGSGAAQLQAPLALLLQ